MSSKANSVDILEKHIKANNTSVAYPSIYKHKNRGVQEKINLHIENIVRSMMSAQGGVRPDLAEMVGEYTIEVNERGIISIRIENFAIMKKAANGTTLLEGLTVNVDSANVYALHDLFLKMLPYRLELDKIINKQIQQKKLPLLQPYPGVKDCQGFYITRMSLVLYFEEMLFTPHVVGPPEFVIPYQQIAGLINPTGPISWLL